jgi:Putative lumazine-binding
MVTRNLAVLAAMMIGLAAPKAGHAEPIPSSFESVGTDRAAIMALLDNYTRAVSTKDQALFESLLLNKAISFSFANSAVKAPATEAGARSYESFRRSVFEGPPFTQKFQDISVRQDGPLASVSLVFVNSMPDGSSWGWKTMQLLKIDGHWKIASEFFTGH